MVGALLSARMSGVRHSPLAAPHSPLAATHSPLAAPHHAPAHLLGSGWRASVLLEGLDPEVDGVSSVAPFTGERREPRRRS